ncbi:Uncharacterized protein conserved in bacteria [Serratia rubidaea]|uniref:Uncharacterized protein conserved in bacteria n=1 Tax=Serratia rubidaea TaxID=61652 RepID=A0A447QM33_SERRU|nr:Uncharacterized protein conserved in bacteria [Serratia rubidaea]
MIERDNGEGTADRACAAGAPTENCFSQPAKFKRVYRIAFSDANVGRPVEKQAYIDLLKIQDPNRLARKPLNNGVLTFPFFTIENVDVVDKRHIIVGNDNNFPFSASRQPNQADDNEFILLETPQLLTRRAKKARAVWSARAGEGLEIVDLHGGAAGEFPSVSVAAGDLTVRRPAAAAWCNRY